MELIEKKITRRDVFCGRIMTVHEDEVLLPNGGTSTREVVDHHGGVCVAALDGEDRLAFVRQFRYAYGKVVLELPAGKLEKDEDPDDAIRRELKEEVGATGKNWRSLGGLYPSPGYTNEIIHLYACEIDSVGEQDFDDDEFLAVEYIPFEKAVEMTLNGEIEDAKSQAIILKLALMRK